MPEYEVTVSNLFDTTSPEEAVKQMAQWLHEYATVASYRVISAARPSDTVVVDAEDLDWR